MAKTKTTAANGNGRSPQAAQSAAAPAGLSRRVRIIASIAILLHFLAIFAATNVASPPFSEFWDGIARCFGPYIGLADLGHGYRFFAPNPGPSHLVEYELTMPNGAVKKGRFPDAKSQWPRLLYHRYFMLAEQLNNFYGPAQEAHEQSKNRDLDAEERAEAEQQANSFEQIYREAAESYARELMRKYGATQAKLTLLVHFIPTPKMFSDGKRLDDKSLYRPVGEPLVFSAGPLRPASRSAAPKTLAPLRPAPESVAPQAEELR